MRWHGLIALAIACAILIVSSPARAAEPLTQAKIDQRRYDLLNPLLLDPYLADQGDEPWRAEGQELIEYVTWNMVYVKLSDWSGPRSAHDEQRAWELANKFIKSDCTQTQVMLAATWVVIDRGYQREYFNNEGKLGVAWNGEFLRNSPVLLHLFIQHMRRHFTDSQTHFVFRSFNTKDDWVNIALDAASSGYFKPEDRQIAANILCDWDPVRTTEAQRGQLADGLAHRKGVDEYIRLTFIARQENTLAWHARGGGFANTVTEDGWVEFKKHLATEKVLLEQAYQIDPTVPFAPSRLVGVAMGLSDNDECTKWFTIAVDLQGDNEDAWLVYINSMRRVWRGSSQELLQVAYTAAEEQDFSTSIPWYYIKALSYVCTDGDLQQIKEPKMLEELHRVIEGYRQNLPPGFPAEKPDSTEAALCFLLEDYDTCNKDMTRAGNNIVREEFTCKGVDLDPDFVRRKAAAMCSSWADQIKPIINLANNGNFSAANKASQDLLKEKAPDQLTRQYVIFLRESSRFYTSFNAGKVTPLLDSPDALMCWTMAEGMVQPDDNGSFMLKGNDKMPNLRMHYRLLNSENYIFRGKIHIFNGDTTQMGDWGVIFRGKRYDSWEDRTFGQLRNRRNFIQFSPDYLPNKNYTPTHEMNFEAIIKNRTITLHMDGIEVVKDQKIIHDPMVGIKCTRMSSAYPTNMIVEDLTLQRLP